VNEKNRGNKPTSLTGESLPQAVAGSYDLTVAETRGALSKAIRAWLLRTPSRHTRQNYQRDLNQFLRFAVFRRIR
jgi:hypothetical protein